LFTDFAIAGLVSGAGAPQARILNSWLGLLQQTRLTDAPRIGARVANGRAGSGLVSRMTYHENSKAIAGRQPEARQQVKTVLIVEDNELNMKLFHDLLDAHGYRTLQTRDGIDALKLAREHRPNLILMDIQLPEVSGLEVTKWLKDDEALREIPVIAVTAFAMKGDEERIRQGGCEAYISKPISIGTFLETVRRHLGEA
jgi:two-component system cell cycle response regulator DivK